MYCFHLTQLLRDVYTDTDHNHKKKKSLSLKQMLIKLSESL